MKVIQPMIVNHCGVKCEVKPMETDVGCCSDCYFNGDDCDVELCTETIGLGSYLVEASNE